MAYWINRRMYIGFCISINLFIAFSSVRAQVPNTLSPADKVYGLSKFWQEVNYNFVYLNKVNRQEWDSTYRTLITIVQRTNNDYEYYRELQKFCASLKDGHTNVNLPQAKGMQQMTTMFGAYRLFVENIDGKPTIVRTNLSKKDEIPAGSEIVEVNGMPALKYAEEFVIPYISSSTDYILRDLGMNRLLQGLESDSYDVKIKKPNGKIISLRLTHATTSEQEVYPAFDAQRDLLDFKWLPNNVAYVSLNSFDDPRIDTLFWNLLPELYKAKGLIIDLRYNGGGITNIGTEILGHLVNDTLLYGSKSSTRMHLSAFKAWGRFAESADTVNNEWGKKAYQSYRDNYFYDFEYTPDTVHLKAKRIVVPTILLIGHGTASAAEDFLIYADKQKHMVKIGENTFGSTGQPYMFELPGGGSARVCTKKDTYPDGREFVGFGIRPDIEVRSSLSDYLAKKDPVLETARKYLAEKLEY